jgi:DNA invertase Pin-like site-specific DNA recombinase
MKIVGYTRVSTDRQAEEGLGLEVQRASIHSWAKAQSHRVTTIHSDDGVSGSEGLDGRLGLAQALADLKENRASGLIVHRLDRLARDLVLQEQLLAEVRRFGGRVFSASAAESAFLEDDSNDPSRRLIRQVLGAVAEYERELIALRLRAGRRQKAAHGGFAYGAPPFGYSAEDGELVLNSDEHQTVERIAQLRGSGLSLREIAITLKDEGRSPRRGTRWHPTVLNRIIERNNS